MAGYTSNRFLLLGPPGAGAVAVIVGLLWLGGCAPRPGIKAIDALQVPGQSEAEPFPDGSSAEWGADPARLADDIERAITDMHWGKLNLHKQPVESDAPPVIRAAALLPDDRTADIIAWGTEKRKVRVAIRVGHFGNPPTERQFIQALANRLYGKPKPQRGGKFEIPE